jgi:glycosyltransferase involved in cell wall biosynthesis
MRILIAHNAYQHSGGEDTVVEAEIDLLRRHGHDVETYRRHNDELHEMPRVAAAAAAIWSHRSSRELDELCTRFRPDLIHAHNTFPLISPSYAWTAARQGIPTVQTLHNFRLLCPQATFLRNGEICEDCLGKTPWRAVARKCYRGSTVQSAVSAGALVVHRMTGTFRHRITRYIALNRFCRDKFIQGGLPAERIRIKPNFVPLHDPPRSKPRKGGLYIGRLSAEKGIAVLIAAARLLHSPKLRVVGSGPLDGAVREAFGPAWLGTKPRTQIMPLLGESLYLVAPSTCHESFGLALVEAFSCGTPVIASRIGAFAELVEDGKTGLLFTPGDAQDLAAKIQWAESHPEAMRRMGEAALREYGSRFTPQRNYAMLMDIYDDAIRHFRGELQAA